MCVAVRSEIRTPLNCVLVMARLLAETGLSDEQLHFTQLISHSGRLLTGIISDVLDFSRALSGKLELEQMPFVLLECIEPALHLCALTAMQKGVDLSYTCDPALPAVVWGDSVHLQQVLMNLVGNAAKFTNSGHIEMHVRGTDSEHDDTDKHTQPTEANDPAPAHGVILQPLLLHFRLRDTGVGISSEFQPRLFAPFEQGDASTRRKFGGTGLGLTISKQLLEAMHGTIEMESEVGMGTEFRFTVRVMRTSGSKASENGRTTQAAWTDAADAPSLSSLTVHAPGSPTPGAVPPELERRLHESIYSQVLAGASGSSAASAASILLLCPCPAKTLMLRTLLSQVGSVHHVADWSQATTTWQRHQQQADLAPFDVLVWSVHSNGSMPASQLLAALRGSATVPSLRPVLLVALSANPRCLGLDAELSSERQWWPQLRVVTLLEPFQHASLLRILVRRTELQSLASDVLERATPAAQLLPALLVDRAATMLHSDEGSEPVEGGAAQGAGGVPASPFFSPGPLPRLAVGSNQGNTPVAAAWGSAPAAAGVLGFASSAAAAAASSASSSTPSSGSGSAPPTPSSSSSKIPRLFPEIKLNIMIVEESQRHRTDATMRASCQ